MSRRCPGCGAFFNGDDCPNQHDAPFEALPPLIQAPPPPLVGRIVSYDWPGGEPVTCMVISEPDADGKVGLMVLHPNVRVNMEDVEESDGRNVPTP